LDECEGMAPRSALRHLRADNPHDHQTHADNDNDEADHDAGAIRAASMTKLPPWVVLMASRAVVVHAGATAWSTRRTRAASVPGTASSL